MWLSSSVKWTIIQATIRHDTHVSKIVCFSISHRSNINHFFWEINRSKHLLCDRVNSAREHLYLLTVLDHHGGIASLEDKIDSMISRVHTCVASFRYSHIDCSGHGVCIEGTCTCDATWTGEACDVQVCPNNCSYHHQQGECDRESHHCRCFHGFKGKEITKMP